MKLGVNATVTDAVPVSQAAERLGYDVVFVPEGFRTDAISVLGAVAVSTERIDLATGIMQIPARTPAMTSMTVATLDTISNGRFRLGLGVSNAHVTEGWHGTSFDKPLARTREFVSIMRTALARKPVEHLGEHYSMPLPGGRGTPFVQQGAPVRAEIPIYLAAVGDKSLQLTGEIADGWFGVFCSPVRIEYALTQIGAGRAGSPLEGRPFDVAPSVPTAVGDDVERIARPVQAYIARFVSLGDGRQNFYYRLMCDLGFADDAARILSFARAGDHAAAAAAVPIGFVQQTALVGPIDHIAVRMKEYAAAGVTTLAVSPYAADTAGRVAILEAVAQAL